MNDRAQTKKINYIDHYDALESAAEALREAEAVGVDLEADSMFHFTEKVCLLQMASPTDCYIVDPLSLPDLVPLAPVFADPEITKIFHGADYDIRSLYRDFGITVNNLFDTEQACRFLGYSATSLDAALSKHFGITLDKKYQKKDWSVRPLPEEMINYAANDVLYLIRLHKVLRDRLIRKNRLEWAMEACREMAGVRPEVPDNDRPLFVRCKGAGGLEPRSLAVLESLLQYRREVARTKDRPPFKVMRDADLMTLAVKKPRTLISLKRTKALSPRQIQMYGEKLVECINSALEIPAESLPEYPKNRKPRMPESAMRRLKTLKEWRTASAEALEIDPALLLNKNALHSLARKNPDHMAALNDIEGLKDWQKDLFGSEILKTLQHGKPKK